MQHADMEKFLATTEEDLQKHFDQACTFPKLSSITHNYIEDSIAKIAILHALANEVCCKDGMIPSVTRGIDHYVILCVYISKISLA